MAACIGTLQRQTRGLRAASAVLSPSLCGEEEATPLPCRSPVFDPPEAIGLGGGMPRIPMLTQSRRAERRSRVQAERPLTRPSTAARPPAGRESRRDFRPFSEIEQRLLVVSLWPSKHVSRLKGRLHAYMSIVHLKRGYVA